MLPLLAWWCHHLYPSADSEYDPKEAKKVEKELLKIEGKKEGDKKHTLKGISKAVSLATKLSPKSQRRKEATPSNVAELKVCFLFSF